MWIASSRRAEGHRAERAGGLAAVLGLTVLAAPGPALAGEPWAVAAPLSAGEVAPADAEALTEAVRGALAEALDGEVVLTAEMMDILAPAELRSGCERGPCLVDYGRELQVGVILGLWLAAEQGGLVVHGERWETSQGRMLSEGFVKMEDPLDPAQAAEIVGPLLGLARPQTPDEPQVLDPTLTEVPVVDATIPAALTTASREPSADAIARPPRAWPRLAAGGALIIAGALAARQSGVAYEGYRGLPAGAEPSAFDAAWASSWGWAGGSVGAMGAGVAVAFTGVRAWWRQR